MKHIVLLLSAVILFASGCASVPPQQVVDLNFNNIPKQQKIGVYFSPLPKISTSFPGANCLLCVGVASVAHSSLTKQVETFKAEELPKTADKIIQQLKAKGYEVVVIDALEKKLPKIKPIAGSTINRNYAAYKTKYGVDQLLVVDFTGLGVVRQYSSYVPVGLPYVSVSAQFYMIDLAQNNYNFYSPLVIMKNAEGEWDAPPSFPGITNAFYQSEEEAIDFLIKPFN